MENSGYPEYVAGRVVPKWMNFDQVVFGVAAKVIHQIRVGEGR